MYINTENKLGPVLVLTVKETQWNKSLSTTSSLNKLLLPERNCKEALTVTVSFRSYRWKQIFSGVSV